MMIRQMPQYKEVMDYIDANGGDPKSAFYNLANQMGVDPEQFIEAMRRA